jgi:cytochrome c556
MPPHPLFLTRQKTKTMIKSLLKLVALLVIGILVYNYFMGTDDEKANAKKIFKEVKEVGVEVGNLLKSEKEKFDRGKYDTALEKIDRAFDNLKSKAKAIDENYLDKISDLESRSKELQNQIDRAEKENRVDSTENGVETEKLKKDLDDLLERTRRLVEEMETKQQ